MQAEIHAEAHPPTTGHAQHEHVGHVVPMWILVTVAAVLLFMTWLTVAVTAIDFGPALNLVIAMAIAVVKAFLVALFFMHLWWDRPINRIVFLGALFFASIFVGLALMDKETYDPNIEAYWQAKDPAPRVENWQAAKAAEEAAKQKAGEEAAGEHATETPASETPADASHADSAEASQQSEAAPAETEPAAQH